MSIYAGNGCYRIDLQLKSSWGLGCVCVCVWGGGGGGGKVLIIIWLHIPSEIGGKNNQTGQQEHNYAPGQENLCEE